MSCLKTGKNISISHKRIHAVVAFTISISRVMEITHLYYTRSMQFHVYTVYTYTLLIETQRTLRGEIRHGTHKQFTAPTR